MSNIASYQEGYTDGYQDGKEMAKKNIIKQLHAFIREQKDEDADNLNLLTPYLRGYNMALRDLKEYITDVIKEV